MIIMRPMVLDMGGYFAVRCVDMGAGDIDIEVHVEKGRELELGQLMMLCGMDDYFNVGGVNHVEREEGC